MVALGWVNETAWDCAVIDLFSIASQGMDGRWIDFIWSQNGTALALPYSWLIRQLRHLCMWQHCIVAEKNEGGQNPAWYNNFHRVTSTDISWGQPLVLSVSFLSRGRNLGGVGGYVWMYYYMVSFKGQCGLWRWHKGLAEKLLLAGTFSSCCEMIALQITQVLCRLRSLPIHTRLAYRGFVWLVGSNYHLCRRLCRAATCPADCIWKHSEVVRYFCLGRWSKYVRELHLLAGHFGGAAWMLIARPLELSSTHLHVWRPFLYVFSASLNALNSCQTSWPCPDFSSCHIYNVCIKQALCPVFRLLFLFAFILSPAYFG